MNSFNMFLKTLLTVSSEFTMLTHHIVQNRIVGRCGQALKLIPMFLLGVSAQIVTRVGGELAVGAGNSGGGGDLYHLRVSALDVSLQVPQSHLLVTILTDNPVILPDLVMLLLVPVLDVSLQIEGGGGFKLAELAGEVLLLGAAFNGVYFVLDHIGHVLAPFSSALWAPDHSGRGKGGR